MKYRHGKLRDELDGTLCPPCFERQLEWHEYAPMVLLCLVPALLLAHSLLD